MFHTIFLKLDFRFYFTESTRNLGPKSEQWQDFYFLSGNSQICSKNDTSVSLQWLTREVDLMISTCSRLKLTDLFWCNFPMISIEPNFRDPTTASRWPSAQQGTIRKRRNRENFLKCCGAASKLHWWSSPSSISAKSEIFVQCEHNAMLHSKYPKEENQQFSN